MFTSVEIKNTKELEPSNGDLDGSLPDKADQKRKEDLTEVTCSTTRDLLPAAQPATCYLQHNQCDLLPAAQPATCSSTCDLLPAA